MLLAGAPPRGYRPKPVPTFRVDKLTEDAKVDLKRTIDDEMVERLRRQAMPVIARIAKHYGLPLEAIFSKSRYPLVTLARRRAMAVLRWSTDWSFPELGRIFGRDHSSVMCAVAKYERELNSDRIGSSGLPG